MSRIAHSFLTTLLILGISLANVCLCAATTQAAVKHSCCDKVSHQKSAPTPPCKHCQARSFLAIQSDHGVNADLTTFVALSPILTDPLTRPFDLVASARWTIDPVPLCRAPADLVHISCQLTV